jgi:hypothetical protein
MDARRIEWWGPRIVILGRCHGRVVVVGFKSCLPWVRVIAGVRHSARYWDRENVAERSGAAGTLCSVLVIITLARAATVFKKLFD